MTTDAGSSDDDVEIERKFLLPAFPADEVAHAPRTDIRQGYLADVGDGEARVRDRSGDCTLTVKQGSGLEREEREIDLSRELFEALWPVTEHRRVEKTRFVLEGDGVVVEVDRYGGELEGLVIAEVEFETRAAAEAWDPPEWIGREVTDDPAYKNRRLARDGRPGSEPDAPAG